ncbi:MAG: tetratricopeptide repeat protein [Nanoarchaeota archaeon]
MAEISLCIITKNNESTIRDCLNSVKYLVSEIVLVDTGSADNTKAIAAEFTDRIYDFEWTNNFSEAKNYALQKATKEWILVLDADEKLSDKDFDSIKKLTALKDYMGFSFIQRNYTNEIGSPNWTSSFEDSYAESKVANGYSPTRMIRLFKNNSQIRFAGVVHDSVEKSLTKIGKFAETDIPIHHFGLLNRGKDRVEFYLELEKNNYHGGFFQDYQIGAQLNTLNKLDEAEEYIKKSINDNPSFAQSWLELGIIYLKKNKLSEAKESMQKAESLQLNSMTFNYLGIIFGKEGEFDKSIEYFRKAIALIPKNADFHFNLGLTYHQMDNRKEAFLEFKRAIELNPKYGEMIKLE